MENFSQTEYAKFGKSSPWIYFIIDLILVFYLINNKILLINTNKYQNSLNSTLQNLYQVV